MNTTSPTLRRLVAPALAIGLLVGAPTTPAVAAGACRIAACQSDDDSACSCCRSTHAVVACDVACCRAPMPLPPRGPNEHDNRVDREPAGGKLGWIVALHGLDPAQSFRCSSFDVVGISIAGDVSLVGQHVRLQI